MYYTDQVHVFLEGIQLNTSGEILVDALQTCFSMRKIDMLVILTLIKIQFKFYLFLNKIYFYLQNTWFRNVNSS